MERSNLSAAAGFGFDANKFGGAQCAGVLAII
jgi:hypothetical protein